MCVTLGTYMNIPVLSSPSNLIYSIIRLIIHIMSISKFRINQQRLCFHLRCHKSPRCMAPTLVKKILKNTKYMSIMMYHINIYIYINATNVHVDYFPWKNHAWRCKRPGICMLDSMHPSQKQIRLHEVSKGGLHKAPVLSWTVDFTVLYFPHG